MPEATEALPSGPVRKRIRWWRYVGVVVVLYVVSLFIPGSVSKDYSEVFLLSTQLRFTSDMDAGEKIVNRLCELKINAFGADSAIAKFYWRHPGSYSQTMVRIRLEGLHADPKLIQAFKY